MVLPINAVNIAFKNTIIFNTNYYYIAENLFRVPAPVFNNNLYDISHKQNTRNAKTW